MKKFGKKFNGLYSVMEQLKEEIDFEMEKLQEKYDSKTENWQESEKGESLVDKINELQDKSDSLSSAIDYISEYAEE